MLIAVLVNLLILTIPLVILYAISYRILLLRFPLYATWFVNSIVFIVLSTNLIFLALASTGATELFDFIQFNMSPESLVANKLFGDYSEEVNDCVNKEGKFREAVHAELSIVNSIPVTFVDLRERVEMLNKQTNSHESNVQNRSIEMLTNALTDPRAVLPLESINKSVLVDLEELNKMTDYSVVGSKINICSKIRHQYVLNKKDCSEDREVECFVLNGEKQDKLKVLEKYQSLLKNCSFSKEPIFNYIEEINSFLVTLDKFIKPVLDKLTKYCYN